jgi:tetratricopeptide (TPR) repeat protein
MFRRSLTFVIVLGLIAAVAFLVYYNSQETALKLAPGLEFVFPLGWLIFIATCVGAVVVTALLVLREGRWALRQWRVEREKRLQERNALYRAEARGLVLAGQHGKARQLLRKAARGAESAVVDVVDIADSYLDESRFAEARKAIDEGIKQYGNDPLLLHARARTALAEGDTGAAAAALERALTAYPDSVVLLEMLRDAFVAAGSWRRAEAPQARIVELRPSDQYEKDRLFEIRVKATAGDPPAERDAALKAIIAIDPTFAPAVIERSRLLAARGDEKSAIKLVEKTLQRRVQPSLLDELGNLLSGSDDERLIATYRKLLGDVEGSDRVRLVLAQRLTALGQFDDASALLEELGGREDSAEIQVAWGDLLAARGDKAGAAASYRKAATTGHLPG